jgi:hypothetical protein
MRIIECQYGFKILLETLIQNKGLLNTIRKGQKNSNHLDVTTITKWTGLP